MNTSLNLFLAAMDKVPWIAFVSVLGGMSIAIIAIIGGFISAYRRQKLWHETARIALERGQPLPPLSNEDKPKSARQSAENDIRTGLILIGVGGGLYLFMGNFLGGKMGYVGAVPGLMGIAFLLFGVVSLLTSNKTRPIDHN